ncbi:hypothetical protein [Bradyrhizobium sp. STM 3566]|uniref:hypothetical protein n=1 Tax=Bradyrhizobium sp. STM 3566 TaxID=578928 RepID=UPI00388D6C6A
MPKFTTFNGYTNVFADKDGRRYLSGIVHPSAEAAIAIRSVSQPVGIAVGVAQVIWDEPDGAAWKPWTRKT